MAMPLLCGYAIAMWPKMSFTVFRGLTVSELTVFTTVELLEALRRKESGCTDYRLSKILGITPNAVRHLLYKGSVMSDETALKISRELDINPALVVFSVIRERSKNQEIRDILDTIPIDTLKASCLALLGFAVFFSPFSNVLF